MFKGKDNISVESATEEFELWCTDWKIGRKLKRLKGEDIEMADQQKETIIDMIVAGNLSYNPGKQILQYKLVDERPDFPDGLTIPRPGPIQMKEMDRFKEQESQARAVGTIAAIAGVPTKNVYKMAYNTDIMDLMAVVTYFLLA